MQAENLIEGEGLQDRRQVLINQQVMTGLSMARSWVSLKRTM